MNNFLLQEQAIDPSAVTATTATTTIAPTQTTSATTTGQRSGALSFDSSRVASTSKLSTSYAESSVDSVVSKSGTTANRTRRPPPPPPPRTSSRSHASPLASPLRSPHQPRPLPDLPIKAEVNRLETPLSCPPTGQQTLLRRNSSLPSADSKVPIQSGSIDSDQPPSHSSHNKSQTNHRGGAAPTAATFFGSLGRATHSGSTSQLEILFILCFFLCVLLCLSNLLFFYYVLMRSSLKIKLGFWIKF